MTTTSPTPETAAGDAGFDPTKLLWCVHVRGPDDLVAVACYDDAVLLADGLNCWFIAQHHDEFDPWISAVPCLWDGAPDRHAASLAKLGTKGSDYGLPTAAQVEAKRVKAFERLCVAPPPAPAQAPDDGWRRCSTCGTHEVSLERTCHNSGCACYAEAETVYEGWKVSAPAQGAGSEATDKPAPVAAADAVSVTEAEVDAGCAAISINIGRARMHQALEAAARARLRPQPEPGPEPTAPDAVAAEREACADAVHKFGTMTSHKETRTVLLNVAKHLRARATPSRPQAGKSETGGVL